MTAQSPKTEQKALLVSASDESHNEWKLAQGVRWKLKKIVIKITCVPHQNSVFKLLFFNTFSSELSSSSYNDDLAFFFHASISNRGYGAIQFHT